MLWSRHVLAMMSAVLLSSAGGRCRACILLHSGSKVTMVPTVGAE
jgi:pyridoxal/pyridoxine/pyridoxamine kinase